jgi:hypothetical protein
MEDEMSKLLKLAAAALLVLAVEGTARADLLGYPDAPPVFDAKDAQIIARNATLRSLKDTDPWLVRRALDALAKTGGPADAVQAPGDRDADPDLDRLRASPEALNDLFQVFKAAAKQRTGNPTK